MHIQKEDGHVKTEEEIEGMQLQAKEHQGFLRAIRSQVRGMGQIRPQCLYKELTQPTP